jgi:hypothetical protein
MFTRSQGAAIALALALSTGCKDDSPTGPSLPLSADAIGAGSVSGHLLGPDNTSLCNALPAGSTVAVQLLVPPSAPAAVVASATPQCPDNSFSIPAANGSYIVRVKIPVGPGIGELPLRILFPSPIAVAGADVVHDLQIAEGSGLGGRVTLDGSPLAGLDLTLPFDGAPGYAGAFGTSGADGGWVDAAGREPMILQTAMGYRLLTPACEAVGTKLLRGPTQESFLFPGELSAIDCALTRAPAIAFSHVRTHLAVTPMPGDFGGLSPELRGQFGMGWGAQFPGAPAAGSRSLSQLYLGGLMVGIRPGRVLSGVDFSGYGACGGSCRDLGLDGSLSYSRSAGSGTRVLWRYSDATSAEGVGLKVAQESYDGVPPHDYVLFHFTFTNSSPASLTFYAGMFGDWDVDQQPGDNVGASAWGGKIMYMTTTASGGDYAGTLLAGNYPVSGNSFFAGNLLPSTADQVAALDGDVRSPTASTPGDLRYFHALGPITLKAGRSGDVWIALIAGQSRSQFFANADAASADIGRRHSNAQSEVFTVQAAVSPGEVKKDPFARVPLQKRTTARSKND